MNFPSSHQAVMPYLILDDAANFIEFVKNVFDAEIIKTHKNADGSYGHCEMQIEGYTFMFSNASPQWTSRTGDFFVYVKDADKTFQLAVNAGASTVMELMDLPYGRSGGVKDSNGNIWWLTTPL